MLTETVAPQQGEQAESTPATETEQTKPVGQEQADAKPQTEEQAVDDGEPREEGRRKRGLSDRAIEERNRARDLQRQNDRLLSLVEQTLVKGQPPKIEQPAGPPNRHDFETSEDYLSALADYKVAEAIKAVEAKAEQKRQLAAIEQLESSWEARLAEETEKDEEFGSYIQQVGTKIHTLAGVAIKEMENGVEVVRYLGDRPSELRRISQLSPAAQVREIGKIEARLETTAQTKARTSKAPPPIEPVTTSSGKGSGPEAMSQAEYEAMRKKQGAWWAR
jgi:hypothetical protein